MGVVPRSDAYLEIWPPAFRGRNLLVQSLLDVPCTVWGFGAPADLVGLGMYAVTREAGCAYGASVARSFALRRGAAPDTLRRLVDEIAGAGTPAERAVVAVARGLARTPQHLDPGDRDALVRLLGPAHAESIVFGIAVMGYVEKFLDVLGVGQDAEAVAKLQRVLARPPSADGLGRKLDIVRFVPAVLALARRCTAGVPDRWPEVGEWLRGRVGHDFPVLASVGQPRAVRALAAMLRDHLDPAASVLGPRLVILAGAVFAAMVEDDRLAAAIAAMAAHHDISPDEVDVSGRFGTVHATLPPSLAEQREIAVLTLARAAATTPAQVDDDVVETLQDARLEPQAIVEVVSWLSLLQLLHRLEGWYRGP